GGAGLCATARRVQPGGGCCAGALDALVVAQARALGARIGCRPARLGGGIALLDLVERRHDHDDHDGGERRADGGEQAHRAPRDGRNLDIARRRPDLHPGAEDLPSRGLHHRKRDSVGPAARIAPAHVLRDERVGEPHPDERRMHMWDEQTDEAAEQTDEAAEPTAEDTSAAAPIDPVDQQGADASGAVAAEAAPEDYAELLADGGIKVQERAPMTPVVKLVFGAQYDKTRLTEFAAALSWAKREGVPAGTLAERIEAHRGGLKAIVAAERAARRPAAPPDRWDEIRARLHAARPLARIDLEVAGDAEFVLLVARRDGDGLVVVAPVTDAKTVEQAIRKSVGDSY
ncbi:MAG: hypothetical protein QOJ53_1577, partial [Sphingomonadales bacterium]|nr:hypothetical protein [Sphingomonadales bacterium]